MSTEYCLVLCTCPEGEAAAELARRLVGERLAACVNILPGLTSVYPWQGMIETGRESLLLIKTDKAVYPHLEARLRALHPYELPEIVAVPIERGLPDYLQWISQWLTHESRA
jgi:periplasmic divalent cation tolerance protein